MNVIFYISGWVANRTFNLVDEKLFADLDINTSKSYNDCAELLRFIDQYAVHNVGTRELDKFLKARPGETLLDILSDQDIAYSILVYEHFCGCVGRNYGEQGSGEPACR